MPRGYGVGRGGYWWHHAGGYWWPGVAAEPITDADLKKGTVYVGPCRCGFGPHAYYRTADGRIVHASMLSFPQRAPLATEEERQQGQDELQAELEHLRARVQELERKLAEKSRTARQ